MLCWVMAAMIFFVGCSSEPPRKAVPKAAPSTRIPPKPPPDDQGK